MLFISALSPTNGIISVHFILVFPLCFCVSMHKYVLLLSVACPVFIGLAAWIKTDDD